MVKYSRPGCWLVNDAAVEDLKHLNGLLLRQNWDLDLELQDLKAEIF